MNTPTPSRYAPPSHASTALSEDLPPAAKSQDEHAADLFLAIKLHDADAVIRLAAKVDDLDSHFEDWNSPLMVAARYDLPLAGLSVLLARSNPLLTRPDGLTSLMLVASGNGAHTAELARLLLPVSDPLALTLGGNSALHYAIMALGFGSQSIETISLLLPVSDLAQKNSEGLTPLARARRANRNDAASLILGEMARREAEAIARCAGAAVPLNSRLPRL